MRQLPNKSERKLSLEVLKQYLRYNADSGAFTWIKIHPKTKKSLLGSEAGTINADGHIQIALLGHIYRAHRLAWFYTYGEWPSTEVDHKDRVKTNNSIQNLRLATRSQNRANSECQRTNKLGVKGVRLSGDKYRATISLGTFDTLEEAQQAYISAAKQIYGEFACA